MTKQRKRVWRVLKRVFSTICIYTIIVGAIGCNINNKMSINKETESTIVFTERQIEILEELNYTDDYSKLSSVHLDRVADIEEVLDYLEAKYCKKFAYSNYIPQWGSDKENYVVYEKDGSNERKGFHVVREKVNGVYEYSDGYMEVYMEPFLEEHILEYIATYVDKDATKVFSTINYIDMDIPSANNNILGYVNATNMIFIDGGLVSQDMYETILSKLVEWQYNERIDGWTQVVLLKGTAISIKDVSGDNYGDYLEEKYYLRREFLDIKKVEE